MRLIVRSIAATLIVGVAAAAASTEALPRIAPVAHTEGIFAFVDIACPAAAETGCRGTIGFPNRKPRAFSIAAAGDQTVPVLMPVKYIRRLERQKRVYATLLLRGERLRESVRVRLTTGPYRPD